jgi:hypothetical protein
MADTDVSACGHADFGRRGIAFRRAKPAPLRETNSVVIIRESG